MLSCRSRESVEIVSRPRSRRMTLPPSGSGSPPGRSQPRLHLAGVHRLLNPVEWHHRIFDGRIEQPQRHESGGQFAWHRDAHAFERRRRRFRDDDRAVAIAHARAVRQEDVPVGQMRVRIERHRRDLVRAVERGAVQRLDVRQHMFELEARRRHFAAREAEEHERIVGIRAVRDSDFHRVSSRKTNVSARRRRRRRGRCRGAPRG
jgi:hypothetical protein